MARSATAKAMPVIFTTMEEFDIWLSGDVAPPLTETSAFRRLATAARRQS